MSDKEIERLKMALCIIAGIPVLDKDNHSYTYGSILHDTGRIIELAELVLNSKDDPREIVLNLGRKRIR